MAEDKIFCMDCKVVILKIPKFVLFDIPVSYKLDGKEYEDGYRCRKCSEKYRVKKK